MRTRIVAVAVLGGLLAACSADVSHQASQEAAAKIKSKPNALATAVAMARAQEGSSIANYPDHGALLKYDDVAPISRGADTWHQVSLSEAHAMRAAATGTMEIPAPNGTPIRLKYDRSIEHGDGNWTWIGHPEGAKPGTEAVITFGPKAVFGTIPQGNNALQVTTQGGKGYMVETDQQKLAAMPRTETANDFIIPEVEQLQASLPKTRAAAAQRVASSLVAQNASPASVSSTIDIVVGYTTGLAARLGGSSQAVTRIHQVVDIANTAYRNSQIDGSLRLLNTVQVNYVDNTANRATLFALSGMTCTTNAASANLPDIGANCTFTGQPAALQPLATAREAYGADLVVLMRDSQPEHLSCGLGWMNGGGQSGLDVGDAAFGFAVVSDSATTATCRNDTLAHETGHNLGLQHNVEAAAGANAALEPEEYGVFPYSFGYSSAAAAANFYTVMSVRVTGQTPFLMFANPRIATCNGVACGDAATADNWRSLTQTLPVVARFRQSMVPITGTWLRADFNGDHQADLVWRNRSTGANSLWRSANSATSQALTPVNNLNWTIAGAADFDGDGAADLLWRNNATGQNSLWRSGNSATSVALGTAPAPWTIAGAADFDGDGKADILWRNPTTGANALWRSGNYTTTTSLTAVGGAAWAIVGVGDFDGDHRADILWRNTVSGSNSIWRSGNSATGQALASIPDAAWFVAGVADFNGDGRADILWRNLDTGANGIWRSGNYATTQAVSMVNNPTWVIVGTGDFDGDGSADIVWRNLSSGANSIWRGGNSATVAPVTTVPGPWWTIAG